jgi:hypothetical protein
MVPMSARQCHVNKESTRERFEVHAEESERTERNADARGNKIPTLDYGYHTVI